MSYTSIAQAATDQALLDRVTSAAAKEAWNGALQDSAFAAQVRDVPEFGGGRLIWPTAIDYESAYDSALAAGNPNPGGDPSVITDANITASVQAHWPADPEGA